MVDFRSIAHGYESPSEWIREPGITDEQSQVRQAIFDAARWRALTNVARNYPGRVRHAFQQRIKDLQKQGDREKATKMRDEFALLEPCLAAGKQVATGTTADPRGIWGLVQSITFRILQNVGKDRLPEAQQGIRPGKTDYRLDDVWDPDETYCAVELPSTLQQELRDTRMLPARRAVAGPAPQRWEEEERAKLEKMPLQALHGIWRRMATGIDLPSAIRLSNEGMIDEIISVLRERKEERFHHEDERIASHYLGDIGDYTDPAAAAIRWALRQINSTPHDAIVDPNPRFRPGEHHRLITKRKIGNYTVEVYAKESGGRAWAVIADPNTGWHVVVRAFGTVVSGGPMSDQHHHSYPYDYLWNVVVDPTPSSEMPDILFRATFADMANMVRGGLDPAGENLTLFTNWHDARAEAERRFARRPSTTGGHHYAVSGPGAGIDLLRFIRLYREMQSLGWAVQEQLEKLVRQEADFDDLNPNALRLMLPVLRSLQRAGVADADETHDAIKTYLENPDAYHGDEERHPDEDTTAGPNRDEDLWMADVAEDVKAARAKDPLHYVPTYVRIPGRDRPETILYAGNPAAIVWDITRPHPRQGYPSLRTAMGRLNLFANRVAVFSDKQFMAKYDAAREMLQRLYADGKLNSQRRDQLRSRIPAQMLSAMETQQRRRERGEPRGRENPAGELSLRLVAPALRAVAGYLGDNSY